MAMVAAVGRSFGNIDNLRMALICIKAPQRKWPECVSRFIIVPDRDGGTGSTWEDRAMLGWIARVVLIAAGFVTSWFVARDAAIFGITQVLVSLLLITAVVAILAFWPSQWTSGLSRFRKSR